MPEDHLTRLQAIFDHFAHHGLKLKSSKCHFFKEEITYLGHEISAKGMLPRQKGVEEIAWMGPPMTYTGVRKFIGAVGYFRCFIKNFAQIAKPLNDLLGCGNSKLKNHPISLTAAIEKAFYMSKKEMCYGTCLGLCRPEEALPAGDGHIQIRLGHHTAAGAGGLKISPSSVCKLHLAWKQGQLPFIEAGIPSSQVGRDTAVQGILDVPALHRANR